MREFRGVWVATVANIDWPSRPGLSTWDQQAELLAIMNKAVALNMNAVVFQVRPQADALYSSAYEPWSPFIT
ncbi:MAG: family 10 glycosylhydrolase, partial [Gemmatimonadaceae bacterium]